MQESNHWSPKVSTNNLSACRVSTCSYASSVLYDPEAELLEILGNTTTRAVSASLIKGVPPFTQKRVIIWYQKDCAACKGSKPVFEAVKQLGAKTSQFTVHEVEATEEYLNLFPHVRVVPLYDIVEPGEGTSVYGRNTRLRTVKNEIGPLREAFPGLVLPEPTAAAAPPPPTA